MALKKDLLRGAGVIVIVTALCAVSNAQDQVKIRFAAMVGDAKLACGHSYDGIGVTGSRIQPQDFRFYVHNFRLVDEAGNETPIQLENDGRWQVDNIALLDFEDGTGPCSNGTPEMNDSVVGTVPSGKTFKALRFTLGVPFDRNHLDPLTQPSPLNLSALMWVWNAGHKFTRLDFMSTGQPRGFPVHLGSTGCMPSTTKTTIPTTCSAPNRPEVEIQDFDIQRDVVIADLAALLKDVDVDHAQNGCMSGPDSKACANLLPAFGLPFGGNPAPPQRFFRKGLYATVVAAKENQ